MRLQGTFALVTGGATGIGQAVAYALAGEGCRVAIAGRRGDKVREAIAAFSGKPELIGHEVDVGDRKSVARLVEWAGRKLGPLDILVNAAGINTPARLMADITPENWDRVMEINATGVFNCIHAVLPQMRHRRSGLIININSIAGIRAAMLGGVAYCASKFAVSAISTAVSLEEGKNGIRVTSVCPGEVDTPILESRLAPPPAEHRVKILRPEDVAAAVLMVACLPPRAHVPELVIKPTAHDFC